MNGSYDEAPQVDWATEFKSSDYYRTYLWLGLEVCVACFVAPHFLGILCSLADSCRLLLSCNGGSLIVLPWNCIVFVWNRLLFDVNWSIDAIAFLHYADIDWQSVRFTLIILWLGSIWLLFDDNIITVGKMHLSIFLLDNDLFFFLLKTNRTGLLMKFVTTI